MPEETNPPEITAAPTVDRRSFIIGAIGIAAITGAGGLAWATPGNESVLRPPGGSNRAEFMALCLRCDRCRSACPNQAIAPCGLEDGLLGARTPKLDFHLGFCDYCGKCADVCPTGALAKIGGRQFDYSPLATPAGLKTAGARSYIFPSLAPSQTIGIAVVDTERCIAWDGATGGCQRCSSECPYEAITLDSSLRPIVDPARCTGCGVCAYICPSNSLHSHKGGATLRGINVIPRGTGDANEATEI